ncbi:MAG: PA14 domain-containing protein, partial [Planctomycetota bacterium]
MSGGFDPYHKWLGIPAHERPANYYRLLGLDPFEADLDAIECAADRLIKYVRDAATVEQRRDAREILDELSTAKHCLLIAERKRAYDAGLRAGHATTERSRRPEPQPKSETPTAVQVTPVSSKERTPVHRRPKSTPVPRHWLVIVSAISLTGLSVLGFVFLRGDSPPKKQIAESSEASETSEDPARQKEAATEPAEDAARESEVKTIAPQPDKSTAELVLPEFASQIPELDPASENEAANAEPIDKASSPEPEATGESKPESKPSVVDEVGASAARGGLLREVWTNVTGSKAEEFVQYVADHPEPNQTETIDRFEPPEDFGDQYGQRLRGYLHPPATGGYEFSIRANAEGWLYVSTDALPDNKRRVEPGTKIEFEAGKAYYVEAFHKESSGRDYLSIGWKLPDGTEEKPIPGERL